jgi:hypothetical protein
MFILRMGGIPGRFSAEAILAAHAAHAKASEDGRGCALGQHGGNSVKGYTAEQHAKACGGRALMHEDAINILCANWNALPLTWRPPTFFKAVIRPQRYAASQVFEQRMIHHVLSFHYNEKVGELQTQSKVHVADRYCTTSTSSTRQETPALLSALQTVAARGPPEEQRPATIF